ncbi:MAG: nuclear transport factor 2 family protein [Leptolyngbyaceae cyanobacterium HOT.MB2.61]|nr:nuclear transport factor 2 family protein [Leptolyngbyaceae cyanobacterium HOT.MB2.61]
MPVQEGTAIPDTARYPAEKSPLTRETQTMIDANEVLKTMCEKYQAAVSANDSIAYGKLFAADGIRIPPGSEPEHGPDEISKNEQKDYDVAKWSVKITPIDALQIGDQWVYGIAHGEVTTVAHADGAMRSFKTTKTWLFHQEASGEWQIKRQMWNLK